MKNKVDRLQAIKEIIISHKISSQEDLLKQLTERGFDLTQATLSRDLKQLQIAKVAGKDGIRFSFYRILRTICGY